ncbi:cyanate transporter [Massilia sp. X63]|uniref:cyanate transporter n=1 Tax=Massilia sp. X63 TaxID=3237285 RepID=UPI0034DD09CC
MKASRPATAQVALIATVALVGLNLRPFITGIGPLAAGIRAHTGLGLQGMALLTLVPMLLMGVLAFAGPALEHAVGARRAVLLALLMICAGCALRLLAGSGWVLVATAALAGAGVALVQAVFPGIVKRRFAGHVGPMMGLYSAMLMGGGALGAVGAQAVSGASGRWTWGLACFAVPALLAALLAAACLPADARRRPARHLRRALLARPRTWLLMACFGLVNGGYSSVVAWLAPAYQEQGWSAPASAGLLAVLAGSQALAALLLPVLASKQRDRRPWLWFALGMQALGFAGLAWAPGAAPHALAAILGAGLGGCFALTLTVALDHLPDPAQAGTLAALMQGGGFILAALPPWLVAALHERSASYAPGWCWHLACVGLVAALSVRFAPDGYLPAMPPVDDAGT